MQSNAVLELQMSDNGVNQDLSFIRHTTEAAGARPRDELWPAYCSR